MSRPKSRNVLLSGNGHSAPAAQTSKDDIYAMKFVMDQPDEGIYPLSEIQTQKTYPDYNPWSERDAKNSKLSNSECLNNGWFEPPLVPNEYYSARNLIQETLLLSDANGKLILQELSLNLTNAYKVRNDSINKITLDTHSFRLPPKVTLTGLKRDAWLRDLANPDIPLYAVSTKIPHGIRNKVLIEHMCSLKVPISRAIWFVKCVLCSEQQLLRKKFQSRQNSAVLTASTSFPTLEIIEGRWLQEWTLQVSDYVLKFSRDMAVVASPEKKAAYQAKLSYLLRLVLALYIELLLDRTYFLSSVLCHLKDDGIFLQDRLPDLIDISKIELDEESPLLRQILNEHPVNYGQLLTNLTLAKMFWTDILHHDFLCKLLGEALLLNYFLVERIPVIPTNAKNTTASALPYKLREDLLLLISSSIVALFRHNSNAFILPDYWLLVGGILYRILAQSSITGLEESRVKFEAAFRLINFRNESLMLNMRYTTKDRTPKAERDSTKDTFSSSPFAQSTSMKQARSRIGSVNRSHDDILVFIDQLDAMNLRSSLAMALSPSSGSLENPKKWRVNLNIMIRWCTSAYRDMGPLAEKVLILCNYIKKNVLMPMNSRGSAHLKAEFESEILESVFSLAHETRSSICMHNLHVLFNELYQLKIISISSYLRKIIACGIFYISSIQSELDSETQNDPQISFHLAILSNLPALNNKQHYQILSKWTPDGEKISSSYERGKELSQRFILDSLLADKFPDDFDEFLTEIKLCSVGVRFLLANWLTTRIKTTVTQSPRLIHISPSTIARLYQFYETTDNLTVFFKAVVRFVLKNEDKVIIYYFGTLHYIGQLLQHHYLLVNFLPASGMDRVSAAYELYNLIIDAYNDLSSREPNLYNFTLLWEFMNQSVDKQLSESAIAEDSKERAHEFDRFTFSRETAESPLKVQVPTSRRNQVYSAEEFAQNLNDLLLRAPAEVTTEDITDILAEVSDVNHGLTVDSFSSQSDLTSNIQNLLGTWMNNSERLSERQDHAFYKLLQVYIRPAKSDESKHALHSYISALVQTGVDHRTLAAFVVKLMCFQVLLLPDVIHLLKSNVAKSQDPAIPELILTLVFDCGQISQRNFKAQLTMFGILQLEYRSENMEEVFYLMVQMLKSRSILDLAEHILGVFTNALVPIILKHTDFVFSTLTTELPPQTNMILGSMLLRTSIEALEPLSMAKLAPLANEFSLPFFQLLFRVATVNQRLPAAPIGESILQFLHSCEFTADAHNSFFGELFNYLEWSERFEVFDYLETFFLTQKQILTVWDEGDFGKTESQVFAFSVKNQKGTELLPVFKDFFKKFSISGSNSLVILLEKFHYFSDFLINILGLVENRAMVKTHMRHLHDLISIFLRLLIIHSASLTTMIAKNDSIEFLFLRNMMALLNSAFMSAGHDKLKILLFDLLLQIKGSLTQSLLLSTNDEFVGISPPQLPGNGFTSDKSRHAPSPPTTSVENPGGAAAVVTMSMILNLTEPGATTYDFGPDNTLCLLTLNEDELYRDSDIALWNDSDLVLVPRDAKVDGGLDPLEISDQMFARPFRIGSVGLIEDTSAGLNSGCISLSMVGAYTTKENPY